VSARRLTDKIPPLHALRGRGDVIAGLKDLVQMHPAGALTDAELAGAQARLLADS